MGCLPLTLKATRAIDVGRTPTAALEPVAKNPGEAARATALESASTSPARYARPTPGRHERPIWSGLLSFEMSASAASDRRKPNVGSRRPRAHAIDPKPTSGCPNSAPESCRSVWHRLDFGFRPVTVFRLAGFDAEKRSFAGGILEVFRRSEDGPDTRAFCECPCSPLP